MRFSREDGNSSTAAAAGRSGAAAGPLPAALAGRPLAADLLSLRELQASLALEENDDAVVRVGTNAIVEILAIDCGMALVDGEEGRGPIRFGWLQGRAMAAAEMDSLAGALKREIGSARDGSAGTQILVATARAVPGTPALPPEVKALGFSSVLILGLGSGGRRSGALVLAARDPEGFEGEQAILAEILAAQMSEQCGRVRTAAGSVLVATEPAVLGPGREPRTVSAGSGAPDTNGGARLETRVAALEARLAIASAVSLSHDAERQVATALRKAIELTSHIAGAIYLVETNDACDDILRLAQGEGDPAWLEIARLPCWRQGEGLPGRVWASGEGLAFASLDDDPAGIGPDVLRRAGYDRMCCEPLKARGRTVGVLELFDKRAGAYDADERGLIQAIGDQVAMAIQNARLVADLMHHGLDLEWQVERLAAENRRALEERLGLEGALAAAAAEPYTETRAAAVLERVLDMTGGDIACVHDIDPVTRRFRMLSQRRLPGDVIEGLYQRPADDPVLASAPPGAGVAVVDLATEEAIAAGWPRRLGVRHVALVPCRTGGETRGILMLGSRYAGAFGETVRDALTAIAALLGLVMEGGGPTRGRDLDATSDLAGATGGDPGAPPERPAPVAAPGTMPEPAAAAEPGVLIQAQKTASIGCLASGFERDFNNTIGVIMGHASHIRALVPDHNPVHDKAAVIEEQSYRAADLVRRLLTFSRGGVGRRDPVDINTLVDETIALLSRTLDPAVVLESRCAADLPPVDVDAGELRQVLLNLAINARDAMPDGGRVVFETRAGHLDAGAVAALPGLLPGDYISIVVSDNGAGMTPEVLEHAFEPFFTTKPITQGSGLGLTVAHDIVREHGGHITLSSAPGIGTAARLYLPVAASAAGRASEPDDQARPQGLMDGLSFAESTGPMDAADTADALDDPDGGSAGMSRGAASAGAPVADAAGHEPLPETLPWLRTCPFTGEARGRILVVDDEQVLRDMMAEMLKSRGYEVITARDGVEALEIYRQEWGKIDLVVCDLIMPRLGGLETFRRITGMNRGARVLLCSGSTHHRQAQQAMEEGAIGLLPKPFGMSELAGWIEKGLAK